MKQHCHVDHITGLDEAQLIERIGDYHALVVRSGTRVTAAVIDAGKNLRVIGRAGVGVDNIDLERATERGIVVLNAPEGILFLRRSIPSPCLPPWPGISRRRTVL